jgi:uncharacterized protein DUF922
VLVGLLALVTPLGVSAGEIRVRAEPSRLSWSLFRTVDSIPGSTEDARTAAEMSFPRPLRIERVDGEYRMPSFTITVFPEPSQTMVRRAIRPSSELLRHEQGHYDIVLLAARALGREIESTTAGSAKELSRLVEECVDKHTERAERLSETYDRETDRSRNPRAQERWNRMIEAALGEPSARELDGRPL